MNSDSKDVIIQQNLYHINMANSTVKTIVKVKGILIRAIMDIRINVSIITLPIVKKLRMTMRLPDESKIIAVDQTKKNVISIVKDVSLSIQDVRVLVNFLVIDVPEDNLLLETDWMDYYQVNLSFYKKKLKF